MSINITWPTDKGTKDAIVPLPAGGKTSLAALRDTIKKHLGTDLPTQGFTLTDTLKDVTNDEDVAQLRDGATLVVAHQQDGALGAPARERISFQPHPKTLTMAGDYEYFAAQGRHPFVYALAEFIDNSLRATRKTAPNPRKITITLLTTGSGAAKKGLVCIQDNGCGMTKHELNDWAVMNYSMEERGAAPQETEAEGRGRVAAPAAGRFLTGDLSFFGVGSKNAAFFMGSSIKVTTRKAGERYVHELCLAAADLEARYRNNEAVYEEDMVHRNPGDESTLSKMEMPFAASRGWLREEVQPEACGEGSSFTRVVIGDLKPDILQQLADDTGGAHICKELAHVYHYYLHGEGGNRVPAETAPDSSSPIRTLPNGEPLPMIVLRHALDARVLWERSLTEVDDDLETRMLRAHKSEFPFTLQVAEKGTVSGVLYYFPYENDRETVPVDTGPTWGGSGPVGAGIGGPTQIPLMSQAPGIRTQAGGTQFGGGRGPQHGNGSGSNHSGNPDDLSDDEGAGMVTWHAPLFKAFWQGRLIPSAHVDTLPFVEAIRQKRTAATKDALPDEVFSRLRGALFLGPAFRVTRNKLLFRDNLPEVLSTAVPGDRNIEKRFKDWLARCHTTLDKSFKFERPADSRTQAALRSRFGEGITAFERISDGNRTVSAGDVVRLSAKPAVIGRVTFFTVPVAVREEGAYANGRIHVEPLPNEIYGSAATKDYSLRRLDAVLDEKEAEEHCAKELAKLPVSLRVEPMRFATGEAVKMTAGDSIPETSLVVMSGGGQKLVRSFYNGEKQTLGVTQRLWWLPHEGAALPTDVPEPGHSEEAEGEGERPAKRTRKARKGKKQGQQEKSPVAAVPLSAAVNPELVVTIENKTPNKEAFTFARISEGLKRSGHYVLEYVLTPAVAGQTPLRCVVPLAVGPGPATSLKVGGEGVAAASSREFVMGETLPPFTILLSDEYGNEVPLPAGTETSVKVQAMVLAADGETYERCKGVAITGDVQAKDSCVEVAELRFFGSKKASAAAAGLPLFKQADALSNSVGAGAQQGASQSTISAATAYACFSLAGESSLTPEYVAVRLRPGPPQTVQLLPGSPWESAEASAVLPSGSEIPDFSVQAFDAWVNPTAPTEKLHFTVTAESDVLAESPYTFAFDASGVATLSGMRLVTRRSGQATIALKLQCQGASDAMQAALDLCPPKEEGLNLQLQVLPSALPAFAQILVEGTPAPMEDRPDDDGNMVPTAIIQGVEAGSSKGGLRLMLLDESGQPATTSVSGKVHVSWHNGCKKTTWNGAPIKLPAIKAPDSSSEVITGFLRFSGNNENPIIVECFVEISPVPGPASSWAVSLVDQVNSQSPEQQGFVLCGQPFALEIEALDRMNNRCGGGAAALPDPMVTLESEGPLEYDTEQWERGWVVQGNEEVYTVRLAMSGHPGEVKIRVQDGSGVGGASLLGEDCLTVDLRPGPPAALAFEGPASVECGTRAVLGNVEVVLRDAAGYPTKSTETFELLLSGSALATDGSGKAAKVVANGGNKAKMTKGKGSAIFKGVTVTAEAPGTYALRVQSASRKMALQEGVLNLSMAPMTAVTGLEILVPAEVGEGWSAGTSSHLLVAVETESGQLLPEDVAIAGLTLRVTPPGGARNDAIVCTLPTLENGESLPMEGGAYLFAVPELTQSGTWTAGAEYAESRPEVRAALGKAGAQLRSPAVNFSVLPGPPVNAVVEGPNLPDRAAATNAPAIKARRLVRNTAVQVQDIYGNAAEAAGVQVRFRLRAVNEASLTPGSIVPQLQGEEGLGPKQMDNRGRAYFGELSIMEGSGAAPAGALDCELICEALGLYPSSDLTLDMDDEGWAVCWRCPVLFSDNAAQFAAVQQLNEQRSTLMEQRAGLEDRLRTARKALEVADTQEKRVAQAAAAVQTRVAGELPPTVKAAEKELKKLEKAAQTEGDAEPSRRLGRWGPSKSPMTGAIDMALRSGLPGIVGVLAQLILIDDERLATVASAALRGLLGVIVVEDAQSRAQLASMLSAKKYPMPDVLPLSQINAWRGQKQGETQGFKTAGELAHTLMRAACAATDRALPIPLPHQRGNKEAAGNSEWPRGCLGYLCNLVRPAQSGHRATVVYGLLSSMMVFETLQDACAYREHVTQNLKMPCGVEMITLDGGRVSSRGIISGSNFRPPPLDKADYVIGSGENAPGSGTADKLEALQSWVEVLGEKEAAERARAAAEHEAEAAEVECRPALDAVESELAEVDAQIAQLQQSPGGSGGKRGAKQRRGQQQEVAVLPEEAEEEAVVEEEAVQEKNSRPKRRRLVKGG